MNEQDLLARQFELERPRLRRIALRMLGDDPSADDAVQDTWLRLARFDGADTIENLPGWLTTVASRICLDVLRARSTRRETAWPGDPAAPDRPAIERPVTDPAPTPEEAAEVADAVGQAMTVVLDSLTPAERLSYVLRDVFDVPFDEIARILGRSPVATRQLASRARRRLREPAERDDLRSDTAVVDAFLRASRNNEFDDLLALLDPDAEVRADGAARALGGDARPLSGSRAVAEFFAGRARAAMPAMLDGSAAAWWQLRGKVMVVFGFTVVAGRVREIELLGDPDVVARATARRRADASAAVSGAAVSGPADDGPSDSAAVTGVAAGRPAARPV